MSPPPWLAGSAWLLLAPVMAWCQFRDLATTADGSRLLSISLLRQHATKQPAFPKIFAFEGEAVSLFYQPPVPEPGSGPYSQYSVGPLQAAGDGTWAVYGTERTCIGGSSCFLNEQRGAVLVTGSGATEALGANARLSRDGRWLLTYSSSGVMLNHFRREDRLTGARVDLLPVGRPAAAPSVALNGAVLIPAYDRLALWEEGRTRTLGPRVAAAVMDDAATTVIYQEQGVARLRVVDLASGAVWPLGPDERENFAPVVAGDGTRVLYLSRIAGKPQVFFSRRDGSDWRQLTDLPSGVREATLSADGSVGWALAGDGALLRLDTRSGISEPRVAPTPLLAGPPAGAAGSALLAGGSGFEMAAAVRLGGKVVPARALAGDTLLVLIPWEFPEGETELEVEGGDERFDAAIPFSVRAYLPVTVAAIHQDFSALVTEEQPLGRGEILHLYATGLGPVDAAGRATLPWEWVWLSVVDQPAEVFYVGVAPGFPGFYQVDLRVPWIPGSSRLNLAVRLAAPDGGSPVWGMGNWPVREAP